MAMKIAETYYRIERERRHQSKLEREIHLMQQLLEVRYDDHLTILQTHDHKEVDLSDEIESFPDFETVERPFKVQQH